MKNKNQVKEGNEKVKKIRERVGFYVVKIFSGS